MTQMPRVNLNFTKLLAVFHLVLSFSYKGASPFTN